MRLDTEIRVEDVNEHTIKDALKPIMEMLDERAILPNDDSQKQRELHELLRKS